REALERPRERVRTPAAGRAGGRQRDALLQHRGEQGSAARADRELPTAGTPRPQHLSAGTRARPLGATCPGTPPTAWHDCSTRTPPHNGGAVSSKRFPLALPRSYGLVRSIFTSLLAVLDHPYGSTLARAASREARRPYAPPSGCFPPFTERAQLRSCARAPRGRA